MSQLFEIVIKSHGESTGVSLYIDGELLRKDEHLGGRYGLDTRLDLRLLRLIVLLALRRVHGVGSGWMTAEQIVQLLEDGAGPGGLRKRLERALVGYGRDEELYEPEDPRMRSHLIQYRPRWRTSKGLARAGLSRGPYRLGLSPPALKVDIEAAWRWLMGDRRSAEITDFESGYEASGQLFQRGALLQSRAALVAGLRAVHLDSTSVDQRMALAQAWERLANLDMELGQPNLVLAAAQRAERLFTRLRHPAGLAHVDLIRAHGYGQLEEHRRAVVAIRRAMRHVDNAHQLRRGLSRAGYIGALGQRLAHTGARASAERKLASAQATSDDQGVRRWGMVWALRRAENALYGEDLHAAVRRLRDAHDREGDPLTSVPHKALFARVNADVLFTTGEYTEGARWAREAWRIGIESGMANQIRSMRKIYDRMGEAPPDD